MKRWFQIKKGKIFKYKNNKNLYFLIKLYIVKIKDKFASKPSRDILFYFILYIIDILFC